MTLKELSRDEQLALVALTEVAVISDRNITDNEVAQIEDIADELGEEVFHELADEAESRFPDRTTLKNFLKTISNPDSRELILGTVLSETLADTLPHEQAEFMGWLAREWNVTVSVNGMVNDIKEG
jgi:hypothetical protein